MRKSIFSILSFFVLFSIIILSCERKRFDNPYDPENRPGPPQLISPQDGEICDLNPPIFEWKKKNEATMYNLQIDTSINFPDTSYPFSFLIYDSTTLNIYQLVDFGYFQDRNYFCRIRCSPAELDPPAWTEWSKIISFNVKIPLTAYYFVEGYYYSGKIDGDTAYISVSEGKVHVINLGQNEELAIFSSGYEYFIVTEIKDNKLCGYSYDYYGTPLTIALFDVKDLEHIHTIHEFIFGYNSSEYNYDFSFDNNRLAVMKDFLTSSGYSDTIFLFDISNYPTVDSAIFIPEFSSYDINVIGNAAYVEAYEESCYKIHIINISDIANPQEIHELKFYNYITKLSLNDNFLYIEEDVNGQREIYVYDITNPLNPVYLGIFNISGSFIEISNTYLLATEWVEGISYFAFYELDQGFPSNELGKILRYISSFYSLGSKYFMLPSVSLLRFLNIFPINNYNCNNSNDLQDLSSYINCIH